MLIVRLKSWFLKVVLAILSSKIIPVIMMVGVRYNLFPFATLTHNILIITDVEMYHLETPQQLKFSYVPITAQGTSHASITSGVKYGKSTINVTVGPENLLALHFNSAFAQLDFIRCFGLSILERIIVSLDTNAMSFFVASLASDSRSYFTFDVQVGHERHEILKCTYSLLLFYTHFASVKLSLTYTAIMPRTKCS